MPLIDSKQLDYKQEDMKPPPGWPKDQPFKKKPWAKYYSTITRADLEIGKVLKKLDELGLTKKTFVFFASDNGFMWGSHGIEEKRVWYEESVRVPAIVRWPDEIKPETKVKSLISSVDFLPTILDLTGVSSHKQFEGLSILSAVAQGRQIRTSVFSEVEYDPDWRMVRTDRWKYVHLLAAGKKSSFPNDAPKLYDMKNDPEESKDLASSKDHAATLSEMKKIMDDWWTKTNTGPIKSLPPSKQKTKSNKTPPGNPE